MNKTESYERKLLNISPRQWSAFLKGHSNLPGPQENIELAEAFARIGTLMDFKRYIQRDYNDAPANTPEEFLPFCGILGLGRYLAKDHDGGLVLKLRERANDPRPRIRKAVKYALQYIGNKNISRLLNYAKMWANGTYLEQSAVITAICDSNLLATREISYEVLQLLDWVTGSMVDEDVNNIEGYSELKNALSYCWSIAVAEVPEKGKPMIERWIKEHHPVVNSIMRENLETERLRSIDPEWTKYWLEDTSD